MKSLGRESSKTRETNALHPLGRKRNGKRGKQGEDKEQKCMMWTAKRRLTFGEKAR